MKAFFKKISRGHNLQPEDRIVVSGGTVFNNASQRFLTEAFGEAVHYIPHSTGSTIESRSAQIQNLLDEDPENTYFYFFGDATVEICHMPNVTNTLSRLKGIIGYNPFTPYEMIGALRSGMNYAHPKSTEQIQLNSIVATFDSFFKGVNAGMQVPLLLRGLTFGPASNFVNFDIGNVHLMQGLPSVDLITSYLTFPDTFPHQEIFRSGRDLMVRSNSLVVRFLPYVSGQVVLQANSRYIPDKKTLIEVFDLYLKRNESFR